MHGALFAYAVASRRPSAALQSAPTSASPMTLVGPGQHTILETGFSGSLACLRAGP